MSPKRVLLTRAILENKKLKTKLDHDLFYSVEWNLIHYIDLNWDANSILNNFANIIITSKHAATIVATKAIALNKNTNCCVVGIESSTILHACGFNILYVAQNVEDLIKHLGDIKEHKNFIYLSGDNITSELPSAIKREIIYKVKYKNILEEQEIEQIKQGIDYILIYSTNCALTLVALLSKYNLFMFLDRAVVIVVSKKIANIIRLYFKNVIYCNQSSDKEMIKLLSKHAEYNK